MTTIHYKVMNPTAILILLILSCCASADEQNPVTIMAQGGTGFKINNLRDFEVNEDTVYKEDDVLIPQTRAQGGTGYKIRYRVTDTSANLLEGTLSEINLINLYKGPVMSLSPLRVFDVDNLITGNTVWIDDLTPDQLNLGDPLKVSGFVDTESLLLVTRIERVEPLTEWKLSGVVSQLNADNFRLNQQLIGFQLSDLVNCDGFLIPGIYVEVFLDPIPNFSLGDAIPAVDRIECVDRKVYPEEDGGEVIIDGVVDFVEPDDDFYIAGQLIDVDNRTKYNRGKAEDVQPRIKVVVEGTADINSGDVSADRVRFIEPRVNLTVPVRPEDQVGLQFFVAGIVLNVTPQTLDPDDLLDGITETTQIRFKGYDYGDGDVYITRVNERGQANFDEVSINGEVNAISQPLMELFGVTVDTTGAVFSGLDGEPLTSSEFFSQLVPGAEVELEDGSLDEVTGIISGGSISLDELPEGTDDEASDFRAQGGTGVRGIGTISATPDVIFIGSFDSP